MRLVLDGISAFEFWMNAVERPALGEIRPTHAQLTSFERSDRLAIAKAFRNNDGIEGPMHLLVQNPEERRHSASMICRCLGSHTFVSADSLVYTGGGIFVISPELCVLRLAVQLPRLEFLRAFTDLLSIFSLSSLDRQELISRKPILTKDDMRRYIEQVGPMPGCKLVEHAIDWVVERSASPRETSMDLDLALPTKLGGQGLPPFAANYQYPLDENAKLITRRNYLIADVAWPERHMTLEYNSSKHHDNEEQKEFDFDKIAAMIRMKEACIPISNNNFSTYDSFASIVGGVREVFGLRDRYSSDVDARRRKTHEELLKIERRQRYSPSLFETARWRYLQPRMDVSTPI